MDANSFQPWIECCKNCAFCALNSKKALHSERTQQIDLASIRKDTHSVTVMHIDITCENQCMDCHKVHSICGVRLVTKRE